MKAGYRRNIPRMEEAPCRPSQTVASRSSRSSSRPSSSAPVPSTPVTTRPARRHPARPTAGGTTTGRRAPTSSRGRRGRRRPGPAVLDRPAAAAGRTVHPDSPGLPVHPRWRGGLRRRTGTYEQRRLLPGRRLHRVRRQLRGTGLERIGDAFIYYLLGHEYGHGIQVRLGIQYQYTIEQELQADCFAGAYIGDMIRAGALKLEPGDLEEFRDGLLAVGDDPSVPVHAGRARHGRAAHIRLLQGVRALGACGLAPERPDLLPPAEHPPQHQEAHERRHQVGHGQRHQLDDPWRPPRPPRAPRALHWSARARCRRRPDPGGGPGRCRAPRR